MLNKSTLKVKIILILSILLIFALYIFIVKEKSTNAIYQEFLDDNVKVDLNDKEILEILAKEGYDPLEKDVIYTSYQDFDNDNDKELLVGIGGKDDLDDAHFYYLAYFDLENDEYHLKDIIDTDKVTYIVNDVNIVERKDSEHKILALHLTNRASLKGLALFEIKNNKFFELGSFASATGVGNDFISYTKEGYLEGVVSDRHSYDVYYYGTRRFYDFKDDELELKCVSIDIGEYPDTAKNVVQEYICLSKIAEENEIYIKELDKRLKELCKNPSKENIWHGELIHHTLFTIEPRIDFDCNIEGNKAIIKTSIAGELSDNMIVDKLVNYELEKTDNRWVITKEESIAYQ